MPSTQQKSQIIETKRPAPTLPGFYSMQALSDNDIYPSVTQFHRKPEPAIRWKNAIAKKKLFDSFALCASEQRWDVFDSRGKAAGQRSQIVPQEGVFMEVPTAIEVDYDEYVASAKEILGAGVSCITWAEHHAYASSVGHSNMVVVARQMILDATDADLEHIHLVDSVASGCRVQGWFMDATKVSAKFMDKYLDRYKWLSKGWPLANDHHIQVMAYRMATLRPLQLVEILAGINELARLGEHISLVAMRMHQANPETLLMFTAKMFEGMESAVLVHSPQVMEMLDADVVTEHAERIAGVYREMFLS